MVSNMKVARNLLVFIFRGRLDGGILALEGVGVEEGRRSGCVLLSEETAPHVSLEVA